MRPSNGIALLMAVAVGVLLRPAELYGQVRAERYDISVGGGVAFHENASALISASPVLTLKGRILATSNLGVGFTLDYLRTETDDDVFPLAQFRFTDSDSTVLFALKQPVAIFQFQVNGGLGAEWGAMRGDVFGGVGAYVLYTDPQISGAPTSTGGPITLSDFLFSFGGSVQFRVSENSGIELSVRDVVFTGYERELLYPLREAIRVCNFGSTLFARSEACQNERFPELNPVPPEEKSTVHNVILSLAFSFLP